MSDRLFIGVDIGTQGVKAAIYDSDGPCLGEAFRKSELLHPVPGAVEEDPERQVRSTCEVIAECAARAAGKGTVRALAIDGQMAGIIGVGDHGVGSGAVRVLRSGPREGGAPLGSALLAGYAEGSLRAIEGAAGRWIRTGAVTPPDPARIEAGRQRTRRYASLLDSINRWTTEKEKR